MFHNLGEKTFQFILRDNSTDTKNLKIHTEIL
jgi:hypothetical protein